MYFCGKNIKTIHYTRFRSSSFNAHPKRHNIEVLRKTLRIFDGGNADLVSNASVIGEGNLYYPYSATYYCCPCQS